MTSTTQRDHLTDARDRLATMTTELRQSDKWAAMLRTARQFHRYSANNNFLIWLQCPEASYLKGFKGWIELGRCVRKGEKSIRIMAPRPFTVATRDKAGHESEEQRVSFAMVSVFDYSQTDPIPGHPAPFMLPARAAVVGDADAAQAAYDALAAYLAADGVRIINEPPHGTERGSYAPATRTINVCPNPAPDMLSVLVHEAAHHASSGVGDDYAEGEVIAQSVAYLVLDGLGLDAGEVSAHYLAGWIGDKPERLNVAIPHIVTTADAFLDAIRPQDAPQLAA